MSVPDIALPDYAATIGAAIDRWDGDRPVLAIGYADTLCGNPGMFHGGVVASLLEMAAVATLEASLAAQGAGGEASPVNTTVEYLRMAGEQRTFASARTVRAGRRLANVQSILWQESEDKPVATAIVNIEIRQSRTA